MKKSDPAHHRPGLQNPHKKNPKDIKNDHVGREESVLTDGGNEQPVLKACVEIKNIITEPLKYSDDENNG